MAVDGRRSRAVRRHDPAADAAVARPASVLPDDAPEHILFQSAAFRDKLARALVLLTDVLSRHQRPYVAFSGGKDSLVCLALASAVRPDVALAWSDDELEYPETVAYQREFAGIAAGAGNAYIVTLGWTQHAGWFRPWRDEPYWREPPAGAVRIGQAQDDWMGRRGYDLTITGLRRDESTRRRDHLLTRGPVYRVKAGTGTRCCPLHDWTSDDVWALIAGWHLPYNPVYDRLTELGVPRRSQRVGPLPLARHDDLFLGWPDLLADLEERYGRRWP